MNRDNKVNRNKYLVKNIIIFGIGAIGTKVITFFMVPLYTNVLTTSDYGIIDLISTICTIIVPLLTLNIEEAVMRFSLDEDADYNRILNVGILIVVTGIVIGLLIIPILSLSVTLEKYSKYIYIYTISLGISQLFLCYLRGKELLTLYSFGNILNSFFIAIFNIWFLVCRERGIEGYFLAYIIANFITALYAFIVGKVYDTFGRWGINKKLAMSMIKYSVALIPNSFMWWIMNSLDRVMITQMINTSANGIYSISYKLPTLMAMFSTIFTRAWSYSAIREEDSEDRDQYSTFIFSELAAFMLISASFLIMIMKPFLHIYVEASYYTAWKYTPYLIIGNTFLTLASFLSTSYTVNKDSIGFLVSGTFGAIINITFNFVLIPAIGISGAALATCISYIMVFIYRAIDIRKYVTIQIVNGKRVVGLSILILQGFIMYGKGIFGFFGLLLCFIIETILFKKEIIFSVKMFKKEI